MTFLQQMVIDGLAIDVGPNTSLPDNLLKLVDKDAAGMTIHTTAALGSVLGILDAGGYPVTAADVGIGPMPGPTVNPGVLVGGASLWLPIGKCDAETAAAWDYIKYLVAPEQQSQWAADTGYVPVRQSATELPPIKDLYAADPRFEVGLRPAPGGGRHPGRGRARPGPAAGGADPHLERRRVDPGRAGGRRPDAGRRGAAVRPAHRQLGVERRRLTSAE